MSSSRPIRFRIEDPDEWERRLYLEEPQDEGEDFDCGIYSGTPSDGGGDPMGIRRPGLYLSDGDLRVSTGDFVYKIHEYKVAEVSWKLQDGIRALKMCLHDDQPLSPHVPPVRYWDHHGIGNDLDLILELVYNGCRLREAHADINLEPYMTYLEEIFEIANRWEIPTFRRKSMEQFSKIFPSDLHQYLGIGRRTLFSTNSINVALRALRMSLKYDIIVARPIIYYHICQIPQKSIVTGPWDADRTNPIIPKHLLATLLGGQNTIMGWGKWYIRPVDCREQHAGHCLAEEVEVSETACRRWLYKLSRSCNSSTTDPLQNPFESEPQAAQMFRQELCHTCYLTVVPGARDVQREMWIQLPIIWEIGNWTQVHREQDKQDKLYDKVWRHGPREYPQAGSITEVNSD